MENKMNLVVDTKLGVLAYVSMVDDIVIEYFSVDGEYQPHIGFLNTIRLFYNTCVKQSKFDDLIPHDFTDVMLVDKLAEDQEFMDAYRVATEGDLGKMDFANAFTDAMDIVKHRKNSLTSFVDSLKNSMGDLINMMTPALSKENLEAVSQIAKDIGNGKVTAQSIVEEYAKSQRFQDVIHASKK